MSASSDGDRQAELQHEVRDVEELRRGLLFRGCHWLDEINDRRGRELVRRGTSGRVTAFSEFVAV
jgi:hypothetical protein